MDISVFEFFSGRFVAPFFIVAAVVFGLGLVFQVFTSKGYYSRIEKMDLPETSIGAKIVELREKKLFHLFFAKYIIIFLDEDDICRTYVVPKAIYHAYTENEEGILVYRGSDFIDFLPPTAFEVKSTE